MEHLKPERTSNMDTPKYELLTNVHSCLPQEADDARCAGQYMYYHYGCDGLDDRGWGCGYRTLQTLCSWVRHHHLSPANSVSPAPKVSPVPSLTQIQATLVEMGDKPESFLHSKQWIGSVEVCLILDQLYDVSCKILHLRRGSDIYEHLSELHKHFETVGTPIMMGGETDNASKGIMGVRLKDPALLLVDPHYFGEKPTLEQLQSSGCVKWLPVGELHADTFYNMCLPKVPCR